MLTRKHRLRSRSDVARIYRKGRSFRFEELSLKVAPNSIGSSRLAVVVSKKVAKSAPTRNRIRRRIYEDFRVRWQTLQPGLDMLLSVFDESIAKIPATELKEKINQLVKKAGLE